MQDPSAVSMDWMTQIGHDDDVEMMNKYLFLICVNINCVWNIFFPALWDFEHCSVHVHNTHTYKVDIYIKLVLEHNNIPSLIHCAITHVLLA